MKCSSKFILLTVFLQATSLDANNFGVEWRTSRVETGSFVEFFLQLPKTEVLDQISVSIRQTNPDWELAGEKNSALRIDGHTISGRIQCFAVEDGIFPGLRISWTQNGTKINLVSPPVWFFVSAPATDLSAQPPIRGLRGPLGEGVPWLVLFGALLIVLLLVWTWIIIRKRKKGFILPDASQIADPWELAQKRIEILKENLPEDELGIKEHIFLLNETLKQYLSGRSGLHLVEQTSKEVVQSIKEFTWVDDAMTDDLKDWLEYGDMAKFARQIPTTNELAEYLGRLEAWMRPVEVRWKQDQQAGEGVS